MHDNGCVLLCLMDIAERRTLSITLAEIMEGWISYLLHNHPGTLTPHVFSFKALVWGPWFPSPSPQNQEGDSPASLVGSLPNAVFFFSGSVAWLQPLSSFSAALPCCKAQRSPHFPLWRRRSHWQNIIMWTSPQIDSPEFICKIKCFVW